jgi:hypothetical protein
VFIKKWNLRVSCSPPAGPRAARVGAFVAAYCLGLVFGASGNVFSAEVTYVVQKGETLGDILYRLNISPLWGKYGNIRKVWRMNLSIVRNEGDRIYPGTEILLPLGVPQLARREEKSRAPAAVAPIVTEEKPTPVASPVASSTPSPSISTDSERETPHALELSLGYGFTQLSASDPATGDSAKLTSSHDVRLAATWRQNWSETFGTYFEFGLRAIDFDPTSNPNKTLSGASNVPGHISLGASSQFGSRLSLRYFVSYGQELFIRGVNFDTLSVDSVPLVSGGGELDVKIYERKSTAIGATAGGTYLGASSTDNYAIKTGSLVTGGLYLEKKCGSREQSLFRLDLDIADRNQNTSTLNQSETSVSAGLTFSFPFLDSGSGR